MAKQRKNNHERSQGTKRSVGHLAGPTSRARRKKMEPAPGSATMAVTLASPGESFLNAVYNGIIEAVLAVNVDTRHIVYWNHGAEVLFGYTRAEVLEQTTEFLYANTDLFQQLYERSTPVVQERGYWHGESQFLRRDGSDFPGEVTFTTFLQTGTEDAYAVVVIRDITDRKQTEDALRQSEERFRQAFDNAAIGKALVSLSGRWLRVNPCLCEITGYTETELLATDWQSITHPDDIAADLAQVRRLLAGEIDHYTLEKRYLHKDGHPVWALLSVALVRTTDGKPLYFIAEMQNRTEQKQLETQLRERERLAIMGTTVAKIVHEIGNPLNGMLTTLQLMEQDLAQRSSVLGQNVSEAVYDLKHEANRLRSLLQELRTFARPPALELRSTNLAEVVAEVIRGQTAYYLECDVSLEQRLPSDLPMITADPEKLAQVLLNLCNNAVEAMPAGGTLTLGGTCDRTTVYLDVSDTGGGLPEGIDVFAPFITTKAQGTGLGLAIAKQIVEAHGGTVTYTSGGPGQGTTFRVALPVPQQK
ncbi:MAG: PAS domain S-box protein [Candidatus Binatia bacterium]